MEMEQAPQLCADWEYDHERDSAGIPVLNSVLAIKQRNQCILHPFIGEAEVSPKCS